MGRGSVRQVAPMGGEIRPREQHCIASRESRGTGVSPTGRAKGGCRRNNQKHEAPSDRRRTGEADQATLHPSPDRAPGASPRPRARPHPVHAQHARNGRRVCQAREAHARCGRATHARSVPSSVPPSQRAPWAANSALRGSCVSLGWAARGARVFSVRVALLFN